MDNLKKIIGKNLAELRKERKITQLEVAEMFGYTDKAVSKWEKGDTLPDVETLYQLASYYGVTLDYLTNDTPIEEREETQMRNDPSLKNNRITLSCLFITIIWLIATLAFVWVLLYKDQYYYFIFAYALTLSAGLGGILNSKWGKRKYNFYIYTLFLWSLIVSVYLSFLEFNLWPLFLIGAPAQIIIILWVNMKDGFFKTIKSSKRQKTEKVKKEKKSKKEE